MNTLSSCKIISFVPTANMERAKAFYQRTLGLHLLSEGSFGLMFEVSGSLLRVIHMEQAYAPHYTILGWKVPNIAAVVDELAQKDIQFEHYEGFDQDAQGIWTAPDGSRVAWFRDPDGNILSLTQFN
jgi:catechol 2,3-dioxygenase-like lactoylglutathione lyase family enzyme